MSAPDSRRIRYHGGASDGPNTTSLPKTAVGDRGAKGGPRTNFCDNNDLRQKKARKTVAGLFRHLGLRPRGAWVALLYSLFSHYLSIYKDLRRRLPSYFRKSARGLGNACKAHGHRRIGRGQAVPAEARGLPGGRNLSRSGLAVALASGGA